MRTILTVIVVVAMPTLGAAQTNSAQPTRTSPWDVTAVGGFLASQPDVPGNDRDRHRDDWYETGQVGVIVGRHLAPHLKAELELLTSGEGRQYIQRYATVPNAPQLVPYASERFATLREVSTLLTWQFFDNEWVHPFVQAGVGAAVERVRWHTWPHSIYIGDPRLPASQVVIARGGNDGPDTTTVGQALLGAGAKIYVSQRAFLRTDGRVAISGKRQHVAFRLGVGVDF